MGDMELAEHYLQWDAPQMAGVDMEYFRRHGYFHLAVGTPDDRLPHAEGKFPTPSGKVEFLVKDAKNFVAPPFRMMYGEMQSGEDVDPLPGYVAAARERRQQSGPRQALSAQRHLAEEPRIPQFLLRQRAAQDQRSGRAIRLDQPQGRGRAQHSRGRSGARVYNDRGDFEGLARSHRRCAATA